MVSESHTPYLENIPAYAIGALDADEVAALEAHLETCASCRTELAAYRSLSDSLLTAVPPSQPPAALRKRLQNQLPRARKTVSRPRFNWSWSQLAFSGALIVLLAMNSYSLMQMRSLQLAQASLNKQIRSGQTVMSMLSYPATQRLAISDQNIVGSVLVDKDRNMVALIVWDMPQLDATKTYQVWLIDPKGDRVSGGIFRPDSDQPYTTQILWPKQSLSNFVGVGVTVEPAGGSDHPTGARLFRVDF
jgi:anti-sigma-K factor RskA